MKKNVCCQIIFSIYAACIQEEFINMNRCICDKRKPCKTGGSANGFGSNGFELKPNKH